MRCGADVCMCSLSLTSALPCALQKGYLGGAIGGGILFDDAANPATLIAGATASVAVGVFFVPFQTSIVALGQWHFKLPLNSRP